MKKLTPHQKKLAKKAIKAAGSLQKSGAKAAVSSGYNLLDGMMGRKVSKDIKKSVSKVSNTVRKVQRFSNQTSAFFQSIGTPEVRKSLRKTNRDTNNLIRGANTIISYFK